LDITEPSEENSVAPVETDDAWKGVGAFIVLLTREHVKGAAAESSAPVEPVAIGA